MCQCACYFMSICVPCYLDYACSLDRDLSLTLRHADSEECRLIRESEMNDHLLSRLINGRKIYSLQQSVVPNYKGRVGFFFVILSFLVI
jgi:hypothetical protein